MKKFAHLIRILLGCVFMFSGFVKGVDPMGFAYKLEDYYVAFGWDLLIPFALLFSIILCTVEFLLGAMLAFNLRLNIASWLVFLMMLFFTLLTLNDAIYNPVPDCGCFGEAIKLTNWQTFYKNLVLLPMAILVVYYRKKMERARRITGQWIWTAIIAVFFASISYWCYSHLPIIDFTEWKVGNKLYAENPKPVKYYLSYKNRTTGEVKEYLSPNYPYNDSIWMKQWEFVSQRVDDPNQYYGKSLVITDTLGTNVTESIIRNPDYQIIINSYDLNLANIKAFNTLNELCRMVADSGISAAVITGSQPADIAAFAKKNSIQLNFYNGDDIVLKTMVRSNPGMMLLKNGEILKKWHYNNFPDFEAFIALTKQIDKEIAEGKRSFSLILPYIPKPNPQTHAPVSR